MKVRGEYAVMSQVYGLEERLRQLNRDLKLGPRYPSLPPRYARRDYAPLRIWEGRGEEGLRKEAGDKLPIYIY